MKQSICLTSMLALAAAAVVMPREAPAADRLPLDATEMKAYLAYMKWLSTGIPDGAKLSGAGMKGIKEPSRATDLGNGAKVFIDTCAPCHGKDGLGQRAAKGTGYQYPPLVGP